MTPEAARYLWVLWFMVLCRRRENALNPTRHTIIFRHLNALEALGALKQVKR